MNETTLITSVWIGISVSYIVTGGGFVYIARVLSPFGWPGYVLGVGYLFWGVLGLGTAVYALFWASSWHPPTREGLGPLGYVRVIGGALFAAFQMSLVAYTAFRAHRFTPAELQTFREAAKAFTRLKRVVAEVNG